MLSSACQFTSKELDPETGLYYFGARYYDARLSRWISTDPPLAKGKYFPKPQDFDTEHDYLWRNSHDESGKLPGIGGVFNSKNLDAYHYAGQNPVKFVDPDGEFPILPAILIFKAASNWRNNPDQQKLKALRNDPKTVRLSIYTTGEAFGQKGLNHLYVTDGKEAVGRNGKSGVNLTGDTGGPASGKPLEKALETHTKVGEALLPAGTDPKALMKEMENTSTKGPYAPFLNDCHNTIQDATRKLGGEVDYNKNYKGRIGK